MTFDVNAGLSCLIERHGQCRLGTAPLEIASLCYLHFLSCISDLISSFSSLRLLCLHMHSPCHNLPPHSSISTDRKILEDNIVPLYIQTPPPPLKKDSKKNLCNVQLNVSSLFHVHIEIPASLRLHQILH